MPGMPGKSHDIHYRPKDDGKGEGRDEGEPTELSKEWRYRLAEAAAYAKQRGKLSGTMESLVNKLMEPKIDWKAQLLKFVSAMLPFNYSWSRPSKRSQALGLYLPMTVKESLDVIVHVDTSGSISDKNLADFLAELSGILVSFSCVNMTLIQCDAAIQEVRELTQDNMPDLQGLAFRGRGGTSHRPVVNWVLANKPEAHVLITLTDGESDIESCFDDLGQIERLILLERADDSKAEALGRYGEVLCLPAA